METHQTKRRSGLRNGRMLADEFKAVDTFRSDPRTPWQRRHEIRASKGWHGNVPRAVEMSHVYPIVA
jgi:hypothetical protein